MEDREMTEGEYRVGVDFNPGNSPGVADIKERTAALIDRLAPIAEDPNSPGARCAAIAMKAYENAAMWAVKALTKQPR